MANVDTVIAVAGIALLLIAAGGLLWTQEFAGLQDHTFPVADQPLEPKEAPISSGASATLEWHGIPDNATAASLEVRLSYTGRAVQGGTATADIVLRAPDGTETRETLSFQVAPASMEGSETFPVTVTWAPVPDRLRAQSADLPQPLAAEGPLMLKVTLQGPADLPLASELAFTLSAEGSVSTYRAEPA